MNTSAVIILQLLPRHGYTETRVALDLVSDAIKHICLDLRYAAATSDQEKVIKEFLHGKDVFVSLSTVERSTGVYGAVTCLVMVSRIPMIWTINTRLPLGHAIKNGSQK